MEQDNTHQTFIKEDIDGQEYYSLDINQERYRWNRNNTHETFIKEDIDGQE